MSNFARSVAARVISALGWMASSTGQPRGRRSAHGRKTFGVILLALLMASLLTEVFPSDAEAAPIAKGDWRHAIQSLAAPGHGCFTASYPTIQWQPSKCSAVPSRAKEAPRPQLPLGPPPQQPSEKVGSTVDFFARVTGQLTSATGSFKVTPTTPG